GTFGDGVFHSTDNGTSWTAANAGLSKGDVYALASVGTYLFAGTVVSSDGTGGGVYRSTDDGASWSQVNSGITNVYVDALAVIGTTLYAGSQALSDLDGGVFRSTDSGKSWTPVSAGITSRSRPSITALTTSETTLFAGTHGDGVFRSTDSGASWVPANQGLTDLYITLGALFVHGTELYAGTGFGDKGIGVFRITDE